MMTWAILLRRSALVVLILSTLTCLIWRVPAARAADQIEVGDVVAVRPSGASLMVGGRAVATLQGGQELQVTSIDGPWVGAGINVNGQWVGGWIPRDAVTVVRKTRKADETAIRKNVQTYVEAFNQGNAKSVADHWAEDAAYVNQTSGERVTGRKGIQDQFEAMFGDATQGSLDVAVESIRFVGSDVAIEDGRATILRGDQVPEESTYTAIHVKKGGKWFIDSIRETELPVSDSNYEYLKEFEWMVGEAQRVHDQVTVRSQCKWALRRNYLVRSLTITADQEEPKKFQATQLIGWDPAGARFRSWVFDSHGGNAEPAWSTEEERWMIGDKGLIESLCTKAATSAASSFQHLKELEWMVGEWLDQDDASSVRTVCGWTPNKNFLTRSFTAKAKDRVELQGIQVVGWDSAAKQIRSWVFDSAGGFGEGTWRRKDNRWLVRSSHVLQDGGKTSAINVFTPTDDNAFTWQSVGREADGQLLPNIDAVTIRRTTPPDANP